jgi:O-methyltransferase
MDRQRVTRPAKWVLGRLGLEVKRTSHQGEDFPVDYDPEIIELFRKIHPYTLTSHERVFALREAVRYVVSAGIQGDIVECGVWRGGSMLVIAHTLLALDAADRELWMYDTFTEMPPPGPEDHLVFGGWAGDLYDEFKANEFYANIPVEQVRALLESVGYPAARMHFEKGMVEDTIPAQAPDAIALCRLDTDLYASTAHEMTHLFPRISAGGVLIIDDYGHFLGAKKAVDEYFASAGVNVLLNRIDYTGRLAVVTPEARAAARRAL